MSDKIFTDPEIAKAVETLRRNFFERGGVVKEWTEHFSHSAYSVNINNTYELDIKIRVQR